MGKIDLLGLGFCAIDYVGVVSHIPIDSKVEIRNLVAQGGGASATAIFTAAKLGISCGFIGKVGDDENGINIIKGFQKAGVNTDGIVIEKNSSSATTFIWIEEKSGNRSIAWNLGTKKPIRKDQLDIEKIKSVKVLHLDGHEGEAALEAIKLAKKSGGKVSLDGGSMTPYIYEVVKNIDFLIVSEEFAKRYTGETEKSSYLKKLKDNNSEVTIITCGKNGFYGYIGDRYIEKGAFKVNVVDTTGAGDVFHGAFISGYIKGMEIKEALVFASAVSAIKCTNYGVRLAIPTYEQTLEFMKKYLIKN